MVVAPLDPEAPLEPAVAAVAELVPSPEEVEEEAVGAVALPAGEGPFSAVPHATSITGAIATAATAIVYGSLLGSPVRIALYRRPKEPYHRRDKEPIGWLSLAKTLSVRLRSDLLLARVPPVKSADAGEGKDLPRPGGSTTRCIGVSLFNPK